MIKQVFCHFIQCLQCIQMGYIYLFKELTRLQGRECYLTLILLIFITPEL